MGSLAVLMIETEQPEGLSARKLVVETAKHNVLTAYKADEGLRLLRRFPNVDAVLVHGLLPERDALVRQILAIAPDVPIIVAAPDPGRDYPGATYVVPSHEPAALLLLLAREFGVAVTN